jgi:hypothetical protein
MHEVAAERSLSAEVGLFIGLFTCMHEIAAVYRSLFIYMHERAA